MVIGAGVYLLFFKTNSADIAQGKELMNVLDESLVHSSDDEHNHSHDHNEAGYDYDVEIIEEFQSVGNTIDFMAATLIEEEREYFSSLFLPENLSKSMFEYSDDPSSEDVILQMIREINREGKLIEVNWESHMAEGKSFSRDDQDINLQLIYNDNKISTAKIDLQLVGTEHFNSERIYYINNSPKNFVDQVKENLKGL
ncbi:hypothetical protein [Metabacillus litoralis]|uniref:hypothetical protein n=1 Tax=Metabacillus TaxID=2675233 RepID=UPI000C4BB34C|nr:hypothetical protein [Metabacillus litoralis]MBM80060.1 hypothetical protein [Planctomycetaceae bacterium]MCM3164527.1 hypothetical protein [Metabacillus litoralis]